MCVLGGKKCSFLARFGMLCFLETPIFRFAILPYYWWYNKRNTINSPLIKVTHNPISKFLFLPVVIEWNQLLQNNQYLEILKIYKNTLLKFTLSFVNNFFNCCNSKWVKGALQGLIQLLATESPLKIMKNAFHFLLEALFVLKIFLNF